MREWSLPQRLTIQVLVALAVGLLMATIGPFGTFNEFAPPDRYLYWIIIIPLNWVQIVAAIMLVSRVKITRGWPQFAVVSLACVIASVPASFEVLWLEQWLRPNHVSRITALYLWPYVLLLSLVIALPLKKYMWYQAPAASPPNRPTGSESPAGSGTPTLLKRIPGHLGRELLCIEAEDHYLRVHTASGSDLILYRMADALSDLETVDGLQVHRSFWIARKAVSAMERDGKRVSLRLTNDLVVPVSRTFLPAVRAAGWLSDLSDRAGSGSAAGRE